MAGLFDILNVSPAERVQPTMPTGLQGIAQTLSGVANRGVQQAAGQDTRTVEAKLNSALQGTDLNTSQGLVAAAQALQGAGEGVRAAEFRRMAADMLTKENSALATKTAYSSVADAMDKANFPGISAAIRSGNEAAYDRALEILGQLEIDAQKAARDAAGAAGNGTQGFTNAGQWQVPGTTDSYTVTTVIPKNGGSPVNEITPIGNSPVYTGQDLVKVGGEFGETPEEFTQRGVDSVILEGEAEIYVEQLNNAISNLKGTSENVQNLTRALAIANQLESSGGFTAALAQNMMNAFGIEGESINNANELQVLMKKEVLASLSQFTGPISDQERLFLESMQADIENSQTINVTMLTRALEEAQRRQVRQAMLTNGMTLGEYNDMVLRQYGLKEEESPMPFEEWKAQQTATPTVTP